MPLHWPDEVDDIMGGDMTAALAYITPAGGSVVTAVAPVGLRDREAGTVGFTTSYGFGRKLERLERDPHVALAYHAREHGFARSSRYVLVQGSARPIPPIDEDWNRDVLGPKAAPFMGEPRQGAFWDRWLREYYADRVPVTVDVERIVVWPDLDCSGEPEVHGPASGGPAKPQSPPKKGTGPRVDCEKAARKLSALPHLLVAWREADGNPTIVPASIQAAGAEGITLASAASLPGGGRRAGLIGHGYEAKLTGLRTRQHTGWLEGERYAPHTESGFRAPKNKTLLLLGNGLLAKQGLKKARKEGRTPAGV